MTNQKVTYTSGPWFVRDHMLKENGEVYDQPGYRICGQCHQRDGETPARIGVVSKADGGWGVCEIASYIPWEEHDRAMADARLIAAAPDLLEAAKAIYIRFRENEATGVSVEEYERLENAIAKAEGR